MSEPTDEAPLPSVEVSGEIVEPAETTTGTIAGDPLAPPAEVMAYPTPAASPPPGSADEALLPPAVDLQDAVGASSRRRRADPDVAGGDDDPARPTSRRVQMIVALALVAGLGIIALVFLGRANSERYLLTSSADRVTPEQGREFPPWGSHPMAGPEWKPVTLPATAECNEHETDDLAELERLYLAVLVDRASTTLTGTTLLDRPAGSGAHAPLDTVSEQLAQAQLLARAPRSRDQRTEIARLMGDVTYWRAMSRLRDASAALLDATKQFQAAAAQRPRHVTDAGAWAAFLRRLTGELHAGPAGAPPAAGAPSVGAACPAGSSEPQAPMGSALPVEPPADEDSAATPAPDAGVPSDGVLL